MHLLQHLKNTAIFEDNFIHTYVIYFKNESPIRVQIKKMHFLSNFFFALEMLMLMLYNIDDLENIDLIKKSIHFIQSLIQEL